MNRRSEQHSVMPSKKQISMVAANALALAIEGKTEASSTQLSLMPTNYVADAMMAVQHQTIFKPKKVDISKLESLERTVNRKFSQDSNFVITKAVNMDNLPEKAQANQKK